MVRFDFEGVESWTKKTRAMKIVFVIIFLAMLPTAQSSTNSVTVIGLQESKRIEFPAQSGDQIATLAIELLQTAGYEADQSVATEGRFKQAQQTAHLHLTFTPPRNVAFRFTTTGPSAEKNVEITEMIIPISAIKMPDYIFVREREKIRAFAKYHPQPAQALQAALKDR